MSENKGLSHSAYGGIDGKDYVPYIPASQVLPELTFLSIFIGVVLAAVFASANTYLALNVGMTIAAGIPAAILGTGLLRIFIKRSVILEANMISGIAAMGESLAGGIVFTLPAIIIWGMNLSFSTIVIVTLLGGLLGILFVVPLRKYLVIEEHGKLAFPESMAAAEVLVTGNSGGAGFKTVMTGLGLGAAYKFLSGGLLLWAEEPEWAINLTQGGKPVYQSFFGLDAMASLAGVGIIVGIEASLYMFAGSVVANFALIPLIKYIGATSTVALFPATIPISEMSAGAIRGSYIRYIGAGAVAAGGFISLAKSMPTIVKSFKSAMSGIGGSAGTKRTELDVPMTWVIGAAGLVFFLAWMLPMIKAGAVGAFMAVLFSFFFAVVSARICGIIGASNNPVSGMTIATLLFVTSVLKALGYVGNAGMITAITIGGIVCVAIAVAGGAGQAMKTTYIIGGTPKKVQIGMYLGIMVGCLAAAGTMLLLINTYGIGGDNGIAAPQATLMSMVVQGVMDGQLPWSLVLVGMTFGVMCELLGIPVLPVALGIYLPIHLSSGILVGGIVRLLVEKKFKKSDEAQGKIQVEKGILLASGLVAGDAIMGIVVAVLAALKLSGSVGIGAKIMPALTQNHWTALAVYLLFAAWIYRFTIKVDKKTA
jgi:putative OPT family oligopeptide transporter